MQNKYLDLLGLSNFFEKLRSYFSLISHTHSKDEITDYTVDSVMSSISLNPVENKVIYAKLNEKANKTITINNYPLVENINLTFEDVGAEQKGAADAALLEAKRYTDAEFAESIGQAPETLNTIEKLAVAFQENDDIVQILNDAITNKADVNHEHNINEINSLQSILDSKSASKHTHLSEDITDLREIVLETIYPIGSIYMSLQPNNPSSLYGFGEWEQITDVFLLASSSTYTAGSTGGESEHTLTVSEMPSHNHRLKTDIDNDAYNVTWPAWFEYSDGWAQEAGETEAPATHTTSTGGGQAHNNMPPYLAVYMFKRIS